MRTNKKHTATAREVFGPGAVAFSERSAKFSDTPKNKNLAGKCSTCFRKDCDRPTRYVIAVDHGYISVRGQGHTWTDAWDHARKWFVVSE